MISSGSVAGNDVVVATPLRTRGPGRWCAGVLARYAHQVLVEPVLWLTVAVAAAVQTWFGWGSYVAGGDNGPFIRGLRGSTRAWSGELSGAGSSSQQSARLIEGLFHDAVTLAGAPGWFAQRVYYTVLCVVMVWAAYWMLRAFVTSKAAAVAGAAVVFFNPYHITTLPNILPIMAIAVFCGLIGASVRFGRGGHVHPIIGVLLALWCGNISRNPPLLVLVAGVGVVGFLWALLCARRYDATRRVWGFFAVCAAASLFWVVPVLLHYLTGTPGLAIVAEKSVTDWSWTQRNSGPLNVVSLVASWAWGDAGTLRATHAMAALPWRPLKYALPLLVLVCAILARKNKVAFFASVTAVVLVVVSVGSNPPFGAVNAFLNDAVPGFWLFRQPMSKFGALLVVTYGVIIGVGFERFFAMVSERRGALAHTQSFERFFAVVSERRGALSHTQRRVRGAVAVVGVLAVAAVAFVHPLFVGTVTPPEREILPAGRVSLPESWLDAGAWLEEAPIAGAVLVLPGSEYYQRGTTWGYYGVDDLFARISSRRAFFPLPGGYYTSAGAVGALMQAGEDALRMSDAAALRRVTVALGVDIVAVRTDVTKRWGRSRTFGEPALLLAGASKTAGLKTLASFEHVTFYGFADDDVSLTRAVAAPIEDAASGFAATADVVAATSADTAVLAGEGGRSWVWAPGVQTTWQEKEAARVTATPRPRSPLWWRATRGPTGIAFELASQVFVDWRPVVQAAAWFHKTDEKVLGLMVNDRLVPFEEDSLLFAAAPSDEIRMLSARAASTVVFDGSVEVNNCNNHNQVTLAEAGIEATATPAGFTLRARDGSACVALAIPERSAEADLGWLMEFDYTTKGGVVPGPGRVCLWVPAVQECQNAAGGQRLSGAGRVAQLVVADEGTDTAGQRIVFYADSRIGRSSRDTEVAYSDVYLSPLRLGAQLLAVPVVESVATSITETAPLVWVDGVAGRNRVASFPTRASDCNRYDDATAAEVSIATRALPDEPQPAVEVSAMRHSACVAAAVAVERGIGLHTVSFEHRSVNGRGGRWCLVKTGSGECAASGVLPATREWELVEKTVELASGRLGEQDEWQLFVYADGGGRNQVVAEQTVVQYRAISVRPTFPLHMAFVERSLPAVAVIAHRQSAADGWVLSGPAAASRVTVDGWANGWELPIAPAERWSVSYRYDPVVAVSVWSLPVVALWALRLQMLRAWAGFFGKFYTMRRRLLAKPAPGQAEVAP